MIPPFSQTVRAALAFPSATMQPQVEALEGHRGHPEPQERKEVIASVVGEAPHRLPAGPLATGTDAALALNRNTEHP